MTMMMVMVTVMAKVMLAMTGCMMSLLGSSSVAAGARNKNLQEYLAAAAARCRATCLFARFYRRFQFHLPLLPAPLTLVPKILSISD